LALLDLVSGSAAAEDAAGNSEGLSTGRFGGDAAFYRAEVYQAAGMLMDHLGVGIEEAMVRLRAYAFGCDRPVVDVAADIVRRRLTLAADNGGE
jgi:hypothetical protein